MRLSQVRFFILSVLLLVLGWCAEGRATPLKFVKPDYYLGGLVSMILQTASSMGYQQYDRVSDPIAQKRAQDCLNKIYKYPAFKYTFDDISIEIIRGVEGEPNGFSFGNHIFITKSMIDVLSPAQLTAVIAHELAHSEAAHNMQRAILPLEASVYQLKTIYDSLIQGKWPKGKDLIQSIADITNMGGFALELQADCYAARQLDYLKSQGLNHSAKDLISTNIFFGGASVTNGSSEDPLAVRTRVLQSEFYRLRGCNIF